MVGKIKCVERVQNAVKIKPCGQIVAVVQQHAGLDHCNHKGAVSIGGLYIIGIADVVEVGKNRGVFVGV